MLLSDNGSALIFIKSTIDKTLDDLHLPDVSVILDSTLSCGKGFTQTSGDLENIHSVNMIHLGVKELYTNELNIDAIFAAIKTMFHELRHVQQEVLHQSDCDFRAYLMALAYISSIACPQYYKDVWNYYHNLKELDAEYFAICNTQDIFAASWGLRIARKQVITFVNSRVDLYQQNNNKRYFIPVDSKYSSYRDVICAFQHALSEVDKVSRNVGFLYDTEYGDIFKISPGFHQDEFIVRQFFNSHLDIKSIFEKTTPAIRFLP